MHGAGAASSLGDSGKCIKEVSILVQVLRRFPKAVLVMCYLHELVSSPTSCSVAGAAYFHQFLCSELASGVGGLCSTLSLNSTHLTAVRAEQRGKAECWSGTRTELLRANGLLPECQAPACTRGPVRGTADRAIGCSASPQGTSVQVRKYPLVGVQRPGKRVASRAERAWCCLCPCTAECGHLGR